MSMNKTCPISNFTSEEDSDGIKDLFYLETGPLTSRFRSETFVFIRPRLCKHCAVSARRKRSYHLPLVVSKPHSKSVLPSGRHPAGQPFSRQYAGKPKCTTIALI